MEIFDKYECVAEKITELLKKNFSKNEIVGFMPFIGSAITVNYEEQVEKYLDDIVGLFKEGLET